MRPREWESRGNSRRASVELLLSSSSWFLWFLILSEFSVKKRNNQLNQQLDCEQKCQQCNISNTRSVPTHEHKKVNKLHCMHWAPKITREKRQKLDSVCPSARGWYIRQQQSRLLKVSKFAQQCPSVFLPQCLVVTAIICGVICFALQLKRKHFSYFLKTLHCTKKKQ